MKIAADESVLGNNGGRSKRLPLMLGVYAAVAALCLNSGIGLIVTAHTTGNLWESLAGAALIFLAIASIGSYAEARARIREELARPPLKTPGGVTAIMADGREIPLDCRYAGWRSVTSGYYHWVVANLPDGEPEEIRIKNLPHATMITAIDIDSPS